MVQENIRNTQNNFCIAPILGTFATVDTSNTTAQLLFKNTSGVTTLTYVFNPNITQNTHIYHLEYIGPRNTSSLASGMVFITMESDETSTVTIKKWNLNKELTRLDLDYSIIKSSVGYDTIDCKNMAIERYYTNLSSTTITGTGKILIDSVDTVVSGTRLYIGPSSNTSYLGNYEEVIATSISGNTVFIKSSQGIPLKSYFNIGDPVTYMNSIYLFNNTGYGADELRGSLLELHNTTGATLRRDNNALYNGIYSANFGLPFYKTLAIVKNAELLYINIDDFTIKKSIRLNTNYTNASDNIKVEALAFTPNSIYRLQNKKIVRSDTGTYSTIVWSTYNYHEDTSARYTDVVSLYADTQVLYNQHTITIKVKVTDQYGIGLSGKTVTFDKEYGDNIGIWGNVNKQTTTNINGEGSITYTSGWYNPSIINTAEEDIKFLAYTDGANILTGSSYVWASIIFKLKAKFLLDNPTVTGYGVPIISQKIDSKRSLKNITQLASFKSKLNLRSLTKFKMPGGNENFQNYYSVAIVKQLQNFKGEYHLYPLKEKVSNMRVKQSNSFIGDCSLSQTVISRHLPVGSNTDSVDIIQFKFLIDAVPSPYSYKNNVNTTIWLRLAPCGYDLVKSTLVFKVRELSYAGDTGYIDYTGSTYLNITEFDAGGGLLGLEVLFTPPAYFHNEAIVYVYLDVFDNAIPTNEIELDYWFKIIPDYKAPYITNEFPTRDEYGVPIDTQITFDVLDNEVGTDISTLEIYINNRQQNYFYIPIMKGYSITIDNNFNFYYTQEVEISIKVQDSSEQQNVLYDMWRFTIEESTAPIVVSESFIPKACSRGISTRTTFIKFLVLEDVNGINIDSLIMILDEHLVDFKVTPIIMRIL